jgi:hypothetical protein
MVIVLGVDQKSIIRFLSFQLSVIFKFSISLLNGQWRQYVCTLNRFFFWSDPPPCAVDQKLALHNSVQKINFLQEKR